MSDLSGSSACLETYATIRVFGDDLDPAAVTGAAGLPPTAAWRKGADIRRIAEGALRPAPTGRHLGTKDILDSTSLERHLMRLLDVLDP